VKQSILVSFIFAIAFFNISKTMAEDGYISDVLYVPLRSGKGNQFRILESAMKSGTKLEILEEDEENGWIGVRTADGKEGFVRAQYIIREPTAQLKLARA
jgi:SH3 domain protein